jgi:hypothetical protein
MGYARRTSGPRKVNCLPNSKSPKARIGAIRGQVPPSNDGRRAADVLQPDFHAIASAFGIRGREN